jgi:DNA-binding Lrp family transcriptional regulator
LSGITLHQARTLIPQQAARLLDVPQSVLEARPWQPEDELPPLRLPGEGEVPAAGRVFKPDMVLSTAWLKMIVVWRASGSAASIMLALRQLTRHWPTRTVPLLVVPFMGDTGRALCAEQGVNWMDLSGNADLTAPGLRVKLDGQPNRFKRRGRPAGIFAPKAVRVVRLLLMGAMDPAQHEPPNQKEMAEQTGLDPGFVSRLVRQLEELGMVQRLGRRVSCSAPADLLEAWNDEEDFGKNRIFSGSADIISRHDGDFHLAYHKLAGALRDARVDHLATGLGAAHLLTGFPPLTEAVFYLREEPDERLLRRLGFTTAPGPAPLRLAVPRDEGVFAGVALAEGIPCAHPLQVYVDLKDMGGQAAEAALLVRERCLGW